MKFVNELHKNAKLPKAITSSFLALVPKNDIPQELGDYKPIRLIGCMYKIISKIIVSRIKRVHYAKKVF